MPTFFYPCTITLLYLWRTSSNIGNLNGKNWVPIMAAGPALLAFILVFLDDGYVHSFSIVHLCKFIIFPSISTLLTVILAIQNYVAFDQPSKSQADARRRLQLRHNHHRSNGLGKLAARFAMARRRDRPVSQSPSRPV